MLTRTFKKAKKPSAHQVLGYSALLALSLPGAYAMDGLERGFKQTTHSRTDDSVYRITGDDEPYLMTYDDGELKYQVLLNDQLTPIAFSSEPSTLPSSFNENGCLIAKQLLDIPRSELPHQQMFQNFMKYLSSNYLDPYERAQKKAQSINRVLKCD